MIEYFPLAGTKFQIGELVKLRPNSTNDNVWYARIGSKRHRIGLVKITLDMVGLVVSAPEIDKVFPSGSTALNYKVLFDERVISVPINRLVKL